MQYVHCPKCFNFENSLLHRIFLKVQNPGNKIQIPGINAQIPGECLPDLLRAILLPAADVAPREAGHEAEELARAQDGSHPPSMWGTLGVFLGLLRGFWGLFGFFRDPGGIF